MRFAWLVLATAAATAGAALADEAAAVNPYRGMQERVAAFEFAAAPKVEKLPDKWVVTFATKAACDATVGIVDKDGKVVRHLASGVLGRNAPWPFRQDSLSQRLEWDGADDAGKPAQAGCRARVGLGLGATFDAVERQDMLIRIMAMAVDSAGRLQAAMANGILSECVYSFDRTGKLAGAIWPTPASVPPERNSVFTWNRTAGGRPVPLHDRFGGGWSFDRMPADGRDFFATMPVASSGVTQLAAAMPDGRVLFLSKRRGDAGATLLALSAKDGACPPGSYASLGRDVGWTHMAVSPDGKWLYLSGEIGRPRGKGPAGQVVRRTPLDKPADPAAFLGEPGKPGSDDAHFRSPGAVACDKDGNVYVADRGNRRIQVFKPDGTYLKTLADATGEWMAVHPGTGAIYLCSGLDKARNGAVVTKLGGLDSPAKAAELLVPRKGWGSFAMRNMTLALDAASDPPAIWMAARECGLFRIEDRGDKLVRTVDVAEANGLSEATGEASRQLSSHQYCLETDKRAGRLAPDPVGPDGLVYSRGMYYASPNTCLFRYRPDADPQKRRYVSFEAGGPAFALTALAARKPLVQDGKPVIGIPTFRTDGASPHGFQSPFCVAPNGDIYATTTLNSKHHFAALEQAGFRKPAKWGATSHILQVFKPSGESRSLCALAELADADGIRVSRGGAVYIVLGVKPLDPKALPDGLAAGSRYEPSRWGTLVKFNGDFETFPVGRITGVWGRQDVANPTHSIEGRPVRVENALWAYGGVSPVSANYRACTCLKSSFDLDLYERSFLPAAQTCTVNVLDANGNVVARLGGYGNHQDLTAGKLAFDIPRSVAVTDEALWVHDVQHRAVIRAKLSYAAEESAPVP